MVASDRRAATRRTAALPGRDQLKERVIAAVGACALQALAHDAGFEQNSHLLAVYGFDGSADDYLALWGRWRSQAANTDLLMCRPAVQDNGRDDPIALARTVEYRVLCDERADAAMAEHHVGVVRLSRHGTPDLYGRGSQ